MRVTVTTIWEEELYSGDDVQELRLDGKLIMRGDDYHDKIGDKIEGFRRALEILGMEYKWDAWNIVDSERWGTYPTE